MGKGDNGGFSQEQIDMYKECFKLMDVDKDGTLSKSDLRAAFDNVGKLMDEGELDAMLGEVGGGCNFDNMVKMFQEKMAGGKLYFLFYLWLFWAIVGYFRATFEPLFGHF
jgi:Ca2+-binding EF-hand superfamily protein